MTTRGRTTQIPFRSRLGTRQTTPRMTAWSLISMPSSDGGARRVIARGAGSCHLTYEDSRRRCLCGWQTSGPGSRQPQRRRADRGRYFIRDFLN